MWIAVAPRTSARCTSWTNGFRWCSWIFCYLGTRRKTRLRGGQIPVTGFFLFSRLIAKRRSQPSFNGCTSVTEISFLVSLGVFHLFSIQLHELRLFVRAKMGATRRNVERRAVTWTRDFPLGKCANFKFPRESFALLSSGMKLEKVHVEVGGKWIRISLLASWFDSFIQSFISVQARDKNF